MFDSWGYPPVAFHFRVDFGVPGTDTSFQEVTGISSEMELETVQEGGENRFKYQLPKGLKHSNLVLKRGVAGVTSPLMLWCKKTLENDLASPVKPMHLTVSLLNDMHLPIRAWFFNNALPVKWEIEGFNSMKNEVAIEKIELTYRYSTRLF